MNALNTLKLLILTIFSLLALACGDEFEEFGDYDNHDIIEQELTDEPEFAEKSRRSVRAQVSRQQVGDSGSNAGGGAVLEFCCKCISESGCWVADENGNQVDFDHGEHWTATSKHE